MAASLRRHPHQERRAPPAGGTRSSDIYTRMLPNTDPGVGRAPQPAAYVGIPPVPSPHLLPGFYLRHRKGFHLLPQVRAAIASHETQLHSQETP